MPAAKEQNVPTPRDRHLASPPKSAAMTPGLLVEAVRICPQGFARVVSEVGVIALRLRFQ